MEGGRRDWCWGWCGIGALAALGLALARGMLREPELALPGPVALWAIDRDGGRLYGLDADLILACRVPLVSPIEIARASDGRLFVLRAGGFLDELDARGSLLRELEVGTCLDLETLGECALLVQRPARALALAAQGEPRVLAEASGLCCISGSLDSVLLGTQDGRVLRVALDGSGPLAETVLGGSIADLAPTPGGTLALDGAGRRLLCLGPDLGLRWQRELPIAARRLGACPGEERVWLVDPDAPRVLRFGPGGVLELDRRALPLLGIERALPWQQGGVLLAAPGAILQLDAQGHLAPGQGGFNYLVGLAR